MEALMVLIDLKVVSRVLRMAGISEEQLHWCEEKLNKVEVLEGKVQRDSSPLFFPVHWSLIIHLVFRLLDEKIKCQGLLHLCIYIYTYTHRETWCKKGKEKERRARAIDFVHDNKK